MPSDGGRNLANQILADQIDSSFDLLSCSEVRVALVVLHGRWFQ
jgi:hypothetical protein